MLDLLREGRVSVEHIERGFKDGIIKGVITVQLFKHALKNFVTKPDQALICKGAKLPSMRSYSGLQ